MAPTEKMFSRRPDVVDSKSRQLRGLLDAAVVQLVPDGVAPLVVKRDRGSLRVEHGPIGQPVKDEIIVLKTDVTNRTLPPPVKDLSLV